jgi:hypothetical protein
VTQGSLADLRALGRSSELAITLRATADQAEAALRECHAPRIAVAPIEPGVVRVILSCPSQTSLEQLAEMAILSVTRHGIPVREVRQETASLDQIFSELTNGEEKDR